MDIFYNTTKETGKELSKRRYNAFSQTAKILRFFRQNPEGLFTPPEVMKMMADPDLQVLNSVRRAMTNLTKAGWLQKTEVKRPGIYGENNYCWKLNTDK